MHEPLGTMDPHLEHRRPRRFQPTRSRHHQVSPQKLDFVHSHYIRRAPRHMRHGLIKEHFRHALLLVAPTTGQTIPPSPVLVHYPQRHQALCYRVSPKIEQLPQHHPTTRQYTRSCPKAHRCRSNHSNNFCNNTGCVLFLTMETSCSSSVSQPIMYQKASSFHFPSTKQPKSRLFIY